ncbi:hypothetical protein [Bradyrhizobium monzae]|nr:hypothetical protein [Bradyrhizobium sp. Oc8]
MSARKMIVSTAATRSAPVTALTYGGSATMPGPHDEKAPAVPGL